ncbi:MAG: metallophosphoesterase family protein [Burkholderiaceae bacterium]|nr:metallophosphoesterase family protein [Burkholderiaceae bacterium]
MKIAWVSDIHGNLTALEAVDADLTREGVDVVVNLGDALSGPLLALDTARWLMAHTTSPAPGQPPWLHITGNHERQLLVAAQRLAQGTPPRPATDSDHLAALDIDSAALAWVRDLVPSTHPPLHRGQWQAHLLGADVALCHGTPANDLTYLLDTPDGEATVMATDAELAERLGTHVPDHITLLACGHTHLARHLTLARPAGSLQLVNPGSVGLPAYDDDSPHPRSSYHRVENGCPDARYALTERTPGTSGWKVSLHSVPYDFEPMARQADRRGRPDWAHALRTGRMPRPTA